MIIIDLDNPNKHECELLFKTDYSEKFQVCDGKNCVSVALCEDGELVVLSDEGFEYTGEQVYDIVAVAAGVIAECETYWYEPESDAPEDDYECCTHQGVLSNRELDGRFEGNW